MRVIKSIKILQSLIKEYKSRNKTIGFVPMMGALHQGHCSLLEKSRRENDVLILSIFVNPKQFAPNEDLKKYPRQKKQDELLAKNKKVDIIFYPLAKSMYPTGFVTHIEVEKITQALCGQSRPAHFKGVTTVVGKLLNIVLPDKVYLGQKDAQQAVVIKQMVDDLNFPVTVRICPIVREADGLALSSRNQYLNKRQRSEAGIIYKSLKLAKSQISLGTVDKDRIKSLIALTIKKHSSGKIDYIDCVRADTLAPIEAIHGKVLIAAAVKFGQTRLIDNITVNVK